jgi:glycosyltransferase involved in cell wall biosynthesis
MPEREAGMTDLIFISTTIDRGGAECLLLNMIRDLRLEYRISVVYLKGRGSLRPELSKIGIIPLKLSPGVLLSILGVIRRNRDTVIQGWMYHGNMVSSLVYMLALGRGRLFWAVHHSAVACATESRGKQLLLKLTALFSRQPRGIVYVSDPIRQEHEQFGYCSKHPLVIPNGIDTEEFTRDVNAGRMLRAELGIPIGAPVLGVVGRNHPVKDYKTFFRAAASLLRVHPDLHVVAAGRGLDPGEFDMQLEDLDEKSKRRVHMLGERRDIPQVLSAIDIFALSSVSESFSIALIEALASGHCCVSTDVVFFKDLFPGVLRTYKPHDYSKLAEEVERFLGLPAETREALGHMGRNAVLEHFSLQSMLNRYREIWRTDAFNGRKAEQQGKKKIIRVISRLNVGGPVIHVTLLTKHFNDSNWQSMLVAGVHGEHEGDMSYLTRQYGVEPLLLQSMGREISPLDDIKAGFKLIRLFIREKPDIVHTHTAKAGTLGRLAAILTGVPQIYHTFHGHVFQGYFSPRKTRLFIMIEKFLARHSTKIIAISESQKRDLVRFGIAPEDKIRVIPLGFDFSRVLPPDPTRALGMKQQIPRDKMTVALIGRLTAIKNPSLFINIAHEVFKQRKNVHFLVIGDGELRQECVSLVKALGIEESFSFTGFIKDLKLIYGSVDIVCLTSINEGTPVSLLEAMACGKIVISTPVGGVPDIIHDNMNGFICEADPTAFAKQIIACLDDPAKYRPLAERAAEAVLKEYDMARLFHDLESLYDDTVYRKKTDDIT